MPCRFVSVFLQGIIEGLISPERERGPADPSELSRLTRRPWGRPSAPQTAAAILAGVLLASVLVAGRESYLEYATWKNRPLGLLDLWYKAEGSRLTPVPSWGCTSQAYAPDAAGTIAVQPAWIGDTKARGLLELDWGAQLRQRIPLAFELRPFVSFDTETAALAWAQAHPHVVVLAFSPTNYRGTELNERMDGFACGNLAVVSAHTACPQRIAAHEIGHALGLGHFSAGLMEARAIGCGARLAPDQAAWLLVRYGPPDPAVVVLPSHAAESSPADAPASESS